jgi:hypothetical protein
MVITMSVMPPFTYPNLSLYSHKVITIICDLQIFPCPTNEDVTRVHHNRMSGPWTSCAIMTFVVVLHCLEAFTPDVTSGVNSLRVESPLPRCGLTSAPSGLELHWMTDSALQKIRSCAADIVTKRMCVGAHSRGCALVWGSPWPPGRIPNTNHATHPHTHPPLL